jgi:hypothetical protein
MCSAWACCSPFDAWVKLSWLVWRCWISSRLACVQQQKGIMGLTPAAHMGQVRQYCAAVALCWCCSGTLTRSMLCSVFDTCV